MRASLNLLSFNLSTARHRSTKHAEFLPRSFCALRNPIGFGALRIGRFSSFVHSPLTASKAFRGREHFILASRIRSLAGARLASPHKVRGPYETRPSCSLAGFNEGKVP